VNTVQLQHNKVTLALHELRAGDSRPLLVLHGLGERSPDRVSDRFDAWAGPVWALDFTGHGDSTVPAGGGYTAEALMGDAAIALAHLGEATLYGRGLGAYVALLLAGARAAHVHGAVLDDGPGLAGGGPFPPSPYLLRLPTDTPSAPDPYALAELSHDVRPPDYAASFVRQAVHFGQLDPCVAVSAQVRPAWLAEVVDEYGTVEEDVPAALARFAEG
jgi:pimeloyl-ACP methyl ester carboxylesterase